MKTIITKHANKRLKQRLGLKKKAKKRHIDKVLQQGILLYKEIENHILYVWYDYRQYIFEEQKGLNAILITVFPREKLLNIRKKPCGTPLMAIVTHQNIKG